EAPIPEGDEVSRFIHSSDHIQKSTGKAKTSAFLPRYEDSFKRFETSLCHTTVCMPERVWELARTCRAETLHARVDFAARVAGEVQLACISSPDHEHNFAEHAVLIAWPEDKLQRKEIAAKLARACPPVQRPPALH
ncbi:unnamed protein product, partial [Phaeothamnion confervicola]